MYFKFSLGHRTLVIKYSRTKKSANNIDSMNINMAREIEVANEVFGVDFRMTTNLKQAKDLYSETLNLSIMT